MVLESVADPIDEQTNEIPRVLLKLSTILTSESNPRSKIDRDRLGELTDSIRRHGVLQPILVRPRVGHDPEQDGEEAYQIVAGHRRYAAAAAAGLDAIPCEVRVLTDEEALELALVENLQREDLHPLDEAEGYEALHTAYNHAVDDIAVKVGKSRSYVYARLKLVALPAAARRAFREGKILPTVALMIARIPDAKLAERATKEIVRDNGAPDQAAPPEPMSAREAARHIEEKYMLRLNGAAWDLTDSQLVPAAGACRECPKRTGNQPELFADASSADLCTDPKCFKSKADALWKVKKAQAIEAGAAVIEGKEAEALVDKYGGGLRYDAKYETLDSCPPGFQRVNGPERSWTQLLGKHAPAPTLVRTPAGAILEVAKSADLQAAAKIAKLKTPTTPVRQSASDPEQEARYKREQAKREQLQLTMNAALPLVVAAAMRRKPTVGFYRILTRALLENWVWPDEEFLESRGIVTEGADQRSVLFAWIDRSDEKGLRGAVLELCIAGEGMNPEAIERAAALYRVDLKKVKTRALKEAKDAARAAAKAPPAPPAPAGTEEPDDGEEDFDGDDE